MQPILKPFDSMTPAGLGLAKNGKLQYPFRYNPYKDYKSKGMNNYLQPLPKDGDLVTNCTSNGILSAGTVGRILRSETVVGKFKTWSSTFVMYLNGEVIPEYDFGLGHMTNDQVQEVIDYYVVTEQHPNRIGKAWKAANPMFRY